jgi:uncharacterized repeat protein (TIGR03803 family)
MVLLMILPAVSIVAAEPRYSTIHTFQSAERNPGSSVSSDGNGTFYGTTTNGGAFESGTVYRVRNDGTAFQRLHTFVGGATDGAYPLGPLTLEPNGLLYGTTSTGGATGNGTIFSIGVNGTGFRILHSFTADRADGGYPTTALTLDQFGNLYGTTYFGGSSNRGTIFKVGTDGSDFQLLHSFVGGAGDGRGPTSGLLLLGTDDLYGTTQFGGQPADPGAGLYYDGSGTAFKIKTDGTGFALIRSLSSVPTGALISDGVGNLYGMGGSSVFKMNLDGTTLQVLHTFGSDATGTIGPFAALVLDDSGNLYGRGYWAAEAVGEAIFRMKTDGTAYQVLYMVIDHNLDGIGGPDGPPRIQATGPLILEGSNLYGTIWDGGAANAGTIFSITSDGAFQTVYSFSGFTNDGSIPEASLIPDGFGFLYGTTQAGGASQGGTVYRIRADGSGFQIVHSFDTSDTVQAPLALDRAGTLYGTTAEALFKVRTDGSDFQIVHDFTGDGAFPSSAVVLDDMGSVYGVTTHSGSSGGAVFKVGTDGTGFQILYGFAGINLSSVGPLVLGDAGHLYGTTRVSAPFIGGTVFRLATDGSTFDVLHFFIGGASDGDAPGASLVLDRSGNIYGTTTAGGQPGGTTSTDGLGTVFAMKTDGSGFKLLHAFGGGASDGSTPTASLILGVSGALYGTTYSGGSANAGTVFTVRADGTAFGILHSFGEEPGDGRNPSASLLLDGFGDLIGTASRGGTAAFGTIFSLSVGSQHPVVAPRPSEPIRVR